MHPHNVRPRKVVEEQLDPPAPVTTVRRNVVMVPLRANDATEIVFLVLQVLQQVLARVRRPKNVVMVFAGVNAWRIVRSLRYQPVLALLKT